MYMPCRLQLLSTLTASLQRGKKPSPTREA